MSSITVVVGTAPAILGFTACTTLDIIKIINNINTPTNYQALFPNVFRPQIGQLKDIEVTLDKDTSITPVAFKHRRIPYHMRETVEKEIKQMIADNIIEPITSETTP